MTESTPSVARGGALMASGSLVSRVLGLVRNSLILAYVGGNTVAGDAWQVASTLPMTVNTLLAAGVINAVLVPQITKAATQEDGEEFVDRLVTLSLLGLAVVTAISIPLAPLLVRIFASDRWAPETFALSVSFARIALPAVFFYGLYAVLGQLLNARHRFGAYGWAPALANVVWIAGLGVLFVGYRGKGTTVPDWSHPMVVILAGSLTLGVAVQALVLLVPLWRSGWRWRPRFGWRGVGLGSASRVALWTLAAVALSQASLAVASTVLTGAGEGHPNRIGYDSAFFLFMTPHGLITVSLATALFTAMSRSAGAGDLPRLRAELRRGLRMLAAALIPTTVAGVTLAKAGTAVVFAGNTTETTNGVAAIFAVLILALLPYGILFLCQRLFLAFEDAKTPFWLSLIAAAVFAGGSLLALLLPAGQRAVGVAGAALASDVIAGWVALAWVRRRLDGLRLVEVWETATKAAFAALFAGLVTLVVVGTFQAVLPNRAGALLTLVVGGLLYVVVYLAGAAWLRLREVGELLALTRRRRSRAA